MGVVKTIAILFHADPNDIDSIKQYLEQVYNADIVCIKESWGKLWIQEGGGHDE